MQKAAAQHLQETAPGEITIGRVKLRKRERSISFPATIAERQQPLEYALVHENGKIHEALFKKSIPVQDLHIAALLLEATGKVPTITVTWLKHGGDVLGLIYTPQSSASLLEGSWTNDSSTPEIETDGAGFEKSSIPVPTTPADPERKFYRIKVESE